MSAGGHDVLASARLRRFLGGLAVVVVLVALYGTSGVRARADSRLSTLVALSALHEGNLRLDEYGGVVAGAQPYLRDTVDGHVVSAYPIATPVLVTPFVAVADAVERLRGHPSLARQARTAIPEDAEFHVAVAVTALAGLAMYGLGLVLGLRTRWAVLFALGFGLCTSLWSVASRGLWPQTTSTLAFALLLLLVATRRRLESPGEEAPATAKDRLWVLGVGAVVAALAMIRVTHLAVVLPLLWTRRTSLRRVLAPAVAGLAAIGVPLVVATQATYGTVFPRYNGMTLRDIVRDVRPLSVPKAFAAVLVSPNRGLFAFTPVLLLAVPVVVAAARRVRRGRSTGTDTLVVACGAAFLVASAVYAVWPIYWGGHSYGPRLLSDAVPFAWVPLAALPGALRDRVGSVRRLTGPRAGAAIGSVALVVLVAAVSLGVHGRGARSWAPYEWNVYPQNVDEHPGRVWSVRDLQVVRGLDLPVLRRFEPAPCVARPVPGDPGNTPRIVAAPGQPTEVRARPGEGVWLRVRVVNDSSVALRSCGTAPTNMSYHVLDARGRVLQAEGARAPLPKVVRPGERALASVQVVAPAEPGHYFVRLALVQEGIRWFDGPDTEPDAVVTLDVG